MAIKDERVDAYIAKSAEFARPILKHIRQLVHAACPAVQETIKWGFPNFMHHGILCNMAAFKSYCTMGFWQRGVVETPRQDKGETAMGQFGRIAKLEDLPDDDVLAEKIKLAMKLNESGVKRTVAKKPAKAKKKPVIPAAMIETLGKNKKALAAFEAMSPSHQREYIEWITEAKREETLSKRLATMLEMLAEGKSRYWKYQK